MKEMKRFISLLLCLVMLVGIVPVNAFAEEVEGTSAVTDPTEGVSGPTEDTSKPTDGASEPTNGASEPTNGASEPTNGASEPTNGASEPTNGVSDPTDGSEGDEEPSYPIAPAALETLSKTQLKAALDEAKAFIDGLTINNPSNDPATVVSNFGTHFTWDNEKREGKKDYLYDWSYYNGVVFEGLEYVYEVTNESVYKDYVVEYMSSLIDANGEWTVCSNSAKTCAGYDPNHGADCYKTASLLLDAYEMTGDSRYLTRAGKLYADLDSAAGKYSLSNAGYNFRHTWSSDPTPDLWLDGLYMILPFRAEYAKRIGDTEELDLIVSRLQWVSDYMYNTNTRLFYHAADSAESSSKTYWLRSMGWYAAAMVDVMDSMSGSNLTAMKAQLAKMVDGMRGWQNSNGMWLNNVTGTVASNNPYEPSGTALIGYAIMKAVNRGWLDDSYLDMATNALAGICNVKLDGSLKDVCYIGVPGSANATFKTNEGKGVGPFIMLYAEVLDYYNDTYPTVTGITVSEGDEYVVGETLAPTVTASYSNGTSGTVSGYTVDGDYDMNNPGEYTVRVTYGSYTVDYTFTVVASAVTMTGLEITAQPTTTKYFVSNEAIGETLPLSIAGLEVTAAFSDGTTKVVAWNEFGKVSDGYSLSFDMSKLGEQDVLITYTYNDVTLTTSYRISIHEKIFSEGNSEVTVEVRVPGVTAITVEENTASEAVITAVAGLVENFASYDIDLEGYNQGEKVTVTLPLPQGVTKPAVYHVPDDGTAAQPVPVTGLTSDGTGVVFVADHFSTYAVGDRAAAQTEGAAVALPGGKIYTLDTNGVTANKNYLIVNTGSNGTGYALTNNNNNPGRTQITISNGTITVEDDDNIAWVFSGSTSGTVGNDGRYVYPNDGSLSLNTNGTNLTISNQNNGVYRIYRSDNYYYYALRYNSGWTGNRTQRNWGEQYISSVYLYELTSSSNGETASFYVTYDDGVMIYGDEIYGTQTLKPVVTVGSAAADSYTVTWSSANNRVATVDSDGVVTAVGEGSTTITATLTRVNGNTVSLTQQIPVTVKTITVVDKALAENSGTVVLNSGDSTMTGGKIKVTYSDDSERFVSVTVGMLRDSEGNKVSTAAEGTFNDLKVFYDGEYLAGTFTLNVVAPPDMNYPEYPDPGSVKVDKYIADATQFQNTGVATINLSTAGLPAMSGVDVILVTDLSNSMAWAAGGRTDAASHTATKMYDLQQAVASFANTFLADENGKKTTNTVSLVTFGGYDADYTNKVYTAYADPTQTLLVGSSSISEVTDTINGIRVLADDALNLGTSTTGYYLSFDGGATYGENYGNTNYDHAFMQTADAIKDLKAAYAEQNNGKTYDASGRNIYILFMTDGAPSNYDGIYYNYKTGDRADVNSTWINENGEEVTYTMGNNRAQYEAGPWFQYIAGGAYNAATDTIPGNPLYWATQVYNTTSVKDIFSIGFDIDNGGFSSMTFTKDDGRPLAKVLEHLVEGKQLIVESADDAGGLAEIYARLAAQIKLAATNAYYVDQMGEYFDLQLASTVTKFEKDSNETEIIPLNPSPKITVTTYEIYTPELVGTTNSAGVTVTADMVGERMSEGTVVETVTFDAAGEEAYSNVAHTSYVTKITVDEETGTKTETIEKTEFAAGENILINDVIYGANFWYNNTTEDIRIDTDDDGVADYLLLAESFRWKIGTINNKEYVLSYDVYLNGSAQGERPKGSYATNEFATLYYENWLGNDAEQSVDTPSVAWESARVSYGFYLVDKNGDPVTNRATGATGNFDAAIRVTPEIFYDEVYLNEIEEVATISVASTNVPEGYVLYDNGATYTIKVNSNLQASGWEIENTKSPATTYVTGFKNPDYSNVIDSDNIEDKNGWDFTNTVAWFAVIWEPTAMPDTVVIDYGLPVDIGVLENDMFGTAGELIGIGTAKKPVSANNQFTTTDSSAFVDAEIETTYGKAEITGELKDQVRYTLGTMQMDSYDSLVYEVRYNNKNSGNMEYYYGDVTVIPATIVYYEDDFISTEGNKYIALGKYNADGTDFDANEDGMNDGWTPVYNDGATEGVTNATQEEDRPGDYNLPIVDANNIYGYDPIYGNMSQYSLGSAAMVHVDANSYGTAEFEFYGTGFDVISLTSNTTGSLIVEVKDTDGNSVRRKMVDTYYGYKWGTIKVTDEEGNETEKPGWVTVNNDPNALYQVPVMKVENLPYGKYSVKLTATYSQFFDHTTPAGYDFYLDAIRIYDPAGTGVNGNDTTIRDAYIEDGEYLPEFHELRNLILSSETVSNLTVNSDKAAGIVFIDGNKALSDDSNVDGNAVSDYTNYGPNNELYLAPGQAVAFNLEAYTAPAGYCVEVHLAMKSVGGTGYVKYWDAANSKEDATKAKTISTATDMYYDITDLNGDLVVIKNTGAQKDAILSITNVKIAYKEVTNLSEAKNSLNNYIESQKDLVQDDYSEEAWTEYQTALTEVKAAYEADNATVDSLTAAHAALEEAYEALLATVGEETGAVNLNLFSVDHETAPVAMMSMRRMPAAEPEVPETTEPVESETTEPVETETTEPEEPETEEPETEETKPDKDAEKLQKEIQKALEKAAKEAAKAAAKAAKELQKAAEKAAKALSKLFGSWF